MVKERKLLSFAPQKRFVDMTSRFFNAIVQVVLSGHARYEALWTLKKEISYFYS